MEYSCTLIFLDRLQLNYVPFPLSPEIPTTPLVLYTVCLLYTSLYAHSYQPVQQLTVSQWTNFPYDVVSSVGRMLILALSYSCLYCLHTL